MPIKRALLSVSDKTGIVEFARKLHEAGVEIISTGGTMHAISDAGIPATSPITMAPSRIETMACTLNLIMRTSRKIRPMIAAKISRPGDSVTISAT